MKLHQLEISQFRNFHTVSLQFSKQLNLFYGHNGSGKTSCLEAIHYLGLGRSFRTRNLSRLVNCNAPGFTLFTLLSDSSGLELPVGIDRNLANQTMQIKIGGTLVTSAAELARLLPLQFINADSHQLLTTGPLARRQFIDWGTFHVEPTFLNYWQRAARSIKQRNMLLKTARSYQDLLAWDEELIETSNWLNLQRQAYIDQLIPIFQIHVMSLLANTELQVTYSPGWKNSYAESLKEGFVRDKQLGYTHQGPHRADLKITIANIPAIDLLSQGQQKLVAYALRLAQAELFKKQTGKGCLILIDDMPSELDQEKRQLVCDIIMNLDAQIFITGIEKDDLKPLLTPNSCSFHVERGIIQFQS